MMTNKYNHLSTEELAGLLEARDRRDVTRFGLVWEANEIERDNSINSDFVEECAQQFMISTRDLFDLM
jgi:hypothetical protein